MGLLLFGEVRGIDSAKRRVQAVISTADVARDGAVIEPRGWRFEHYDRNPVVLWNHDTAQLPIARAVPGERMVTDREVIDVHEFARHPQAELIWELVAEGFVHATSVRWLPGDTEIRTVGGEAVLVFTRGHELLEVSYVTVPADPGALVVRADGGRLFDIVDGARRFPLFEPDGRQPGTAAGRAARRLREAAEALAALSSRRGGGESNLEVAHV